MKFKIKVTGLSVARLNGISALCGRTLKAGDLVELDLRDIGGFVLPGGGNIYGEKFGSNPDYEIVSSEEYALQLTLTETIAHLKGLIG